MKKYFFYNVFLVAITTMNLSAFAQEEIKTSLDKDTIETKSKFTTGINFLSNNVYLGRTDSATVTYISPYIQYTHKSGLYGLVSMSYQPNPGARRIDLVTLEAGYDLSLGDKFNWGIYADKFFYNSKSQSITAVNNFGIGTYASYNFFNVIQLLGGGGLSFNEKADYVVDLGLSHTFTADNFEIAPTALMNAGTQNFYNSYITNRTIQNKKGKVITVVQQQTVQEASAFKVLDYEFSLPMNYKLNHFKVEITPTYAVPVNPATILSSTGLEKENLSNHFYLIADLSYYF